MAGGTDASRRMRSSGRTRALVGGSRHRTRLAPTVVLLLAACGPTSPVDGNRSTDGPPSTSPPTGGSATTTAGPAQDERPTAPVPLEHAVIVDLAVGWRPEGGLNAEERAAQRRRIQDAEDVIVRALGEHGRVRRQLHASGQVALAVDDKGLSVLGDLDLVAAVHEDTPASPDVTE